MVSPNNQTLLVLTTGYNRVYTLGVPGGAFPWYSAVSNACAAGLAMSSDGQTPVVADYYNDAITVFTGGYGHWSKPVDLDLRLVKSAVNPQPGVPAGEYPFWVAGERDRSKRGGYERFARTIRALESGAAWAHGRLDLKRGVQ